MTKLSTTAKLAFPLVPAGSFIGRMVPLEGIEPGDEVALSEPFQRPAGIEFFAYVPEPGWVRVCARNRTGFPVGVPEGQYEVSSKGATEGLQHPSRTASSGCDAVMEDAGQPVIGTALTIASAGVRLYSGADRLTAGDLPSAVRDTENRRLVRKGPTPMTAPTW